MMANSIDKEIEAIKTLLVTLEPLEPTVRESVITYVLGRLGVVLPESQPPVAGQEKPSRGVGAVWPEGKVVIHKEVHIKDLKDEKKPRSAVEMAVLVAYYLSQRAREKDRKNFVTVKDLEMYFKIAGFRLPTQMHYTAFSAIKGGYLDSAGTGKYKLNPVGYNLVTHSMPILTKVAGRPPKAAKKKKKKIGKKKTGKKKDAGNGSRKKK